jgi:hypothetical protein
MSELLFAKSKAEPVSLMFAESSPANSSVHFSLNRKEGGYLNFRIPAYQLGAMIENLKHVQETLESEGIDTGKTCTLIPAAPFGFFEVN